MNTASHPIVHQSKMTTRATRVLSTALLIAAIFVVGVNTWLALRSLTVFNQSRGWVEHTWQVLYQIERITGSLKDAENGNRGYLISGDEAYLEPYLQARRDLPLELDALQQFTSDNASQQPRIAEMRAVIEARLHLLEQGIEKRHEGRTDSIRALVLSGTGKAEMEHLRALAASMQEQENLLLAQRTHIAHRNEIRARVTIVFAGALDLLLIVITFWYLVRERQLRAIADSTADKLGKLQFVSDVALTQLSSADLTVELLERVRKVLGSEAALLATFHGAELRVEAAVGLTLSRGSVIDFHPNDPIRQAVDSGRVITVSDMTGAGLAARDFRKDLRSMLVMPLTIAGQVEGVVIAGKQTDVGVSGLLSRFGTQDEQLLSVVADRIAIALDRANAYEAEHQARRLAEASAEQVKLLNADLEARVRLRTIELETTNRELEAFSFSVSHDLRAPLRTVDGFSLALEEDYKDQLGADGRDFIRRIRDGVQRMGQLIDALLQLSRITRAELNSEFFNIGSLAEEVAESLRAEYPERDLRFVIHPDMVVDADQRLTRVALENLLGNAVKFTAKIPQALIEFGRELSGEFFIRDNGAGFDMQYAGKLFTAFQRLHGDKDFKGSGIGLATVARVVHRHHGTIRAEGAVDQGAVFRFTLG